MSTLHELLSLQSESGNCTEVFNWLVDLGHHEKWDLSQDKKGNLYAVKGKSETYPCVVAHIDTVHDIQEGGIRPVEVDGYITGINPHTMQQTGIGGDDKCGVWAAVQCLKNLDYCKAVFFVDEEIGCQGSENCELVFFKNCRFVLQADRRGYKDFVTEISGRPLSSDAFQEDVMPILIEFGYDYSNGSMTDVMALRDNEVGISVANISAGYFNPHCDCEFIGIKQLSNACLLLQEICKRLTATYPFVAPKPVYGGPTRSYNWNDSFFQSQKQNSSGINYSALQAGVGHDHESGEVFPDYDPLDRYCASSQPWWKNGNSVCHCCGDVIFSDDLVAATSLPTCIDCAAQMHIGEGAPGVGRAAKMARQAKQDVKESQSNQWWREPSRSLRRSRRKAEKARRKFERAAKKLGKPIVTSPIK